NRDGSRLDDGTVFANEPDALKLFQSFLATGLPQRLVGIREVGLHLLTVQRTPKLCKLLGLGLCDLGRLLLLLRRSTVEIRNRIPDTPIVEGLRLRLRQADLMCDLREGLRALAIVRQVLRQVLRRREVVTSIADVGLGRAPQLVQELFALFVGSVLAGDTYSISKQFRLLIRVLRNLRRRFEATLFDPLAGLWFQFREQSVVRSLGVLTIGIGFRPVLLAG